MNVNIYVNLFLADLKKSLKRNQLLLEDITKHLFTNVASLNIDIYKVDLSQESIQGILELDQQHGRPQIYLNDSDSEENQRFTLAHELGHLYQHARWSYESSRDDYNYVNIKYARSNADTEKERQADKFAEVLLMPKGNFIKMYELTKGDVKAMADYFNVSNDSIVSRAIDLELTKS
jgi:Zn-dependent peptidase ImmA (M78 family)